MMKASISFPAIAGVIVCLSSVAHIRSSVTITGVVNAVALKNTNSVCSYFMNPNSQTITSTGGYINVNITTDQGCGWTAASNDAWITVINGASGSGNGLVQFYVAQGPGSQRIGSLTIAGSIFKVTQIQPAINNIDQFLEKCPTSDPAFSMILSDFPIRRNGVLVQSFTCSEPISGLPVSQYTDEIIVLQGLRAIYYMDRGQSGHLPWTPGTLYDWMKSKNIGINISDTTPFSYCCDTIEGRKYLGIRAQDEFNRNFDREWRGISGNIELYAHETRHLDGFGHNSCCGISGGCDQTFDTTNLSAYGFQWWLAKSWLLGDIYIGLSCLDPTRIQQISGWHLSGLNGYRSRFCDVLPPDLGAGQIPYPGGLCGNIGYEADVAPRLNGSRTVVVSDWVQVGRFSVGLDTPAPGSEFQRADCAPRSTLGDGQITVADWVQAGRYSVGLDRLTEVGGPASNTDRMIEQPAEMKAGATDRVVRAVNAGFTRGRVGTVDVEFESLGDESAMAFTLNYDPHKAVFLDAIELANEVGLMVNSRQALKGHLAIALSMPAGKAFSAGRQKLLRLRFIPTESEGFSAMELTFDDSLVRRDLVNPSAMRLPQPQFVSAIITIVDDRPFSDPFRSAVK